MNFSTLKMNVIRFGMAVNFCRQQHLGCSLVEY